MIIKLCDHVIEVLKTSPTLLRMRAPIKVIGSLHGRFNDLLRMFSSFGLPTDEPFKGNFFFSRNLN